MKTIILIITTVLFTTSVVGQNINNNEGIQGTWQALNIERVLCDSPTDNKVIDFECPEFCMTIIFRANGYSTSSYTQASGTENTTSNYKISGDKMTICENAQNNSCHSVTFEISDKELKVTATGEDTGCDVITTFVRK